MKEDNKRSLLGIMLRCEEHSPYNTIDKRAALIFADNDIDAVEEAFAVWEAAGLLTRLAPIRSASPETVVARFDWLLLGLCGRAALAGKVITEKDRAEAIRGSNQRMLLARLTGPGYSTPDWDTVTKKAAMQGANNDLEAIEEVFALWEGANVLTRVADVRTATPDMVVARFNRQLLAAHGAQTLKISS